MTQDVSEQTDRVIENSRKYVLPEDIVQHSFDITLFQQKLKEDITAIHRALGEEDSIVKGED